MRRELNVDWMRNLCNAWASLLSMVFFRIWGKPANFKRMNLFRKTAQASLRMDEMEQKASLKMIQRRRFPTPASPACSPLRRCKHAMKWGETFVNQLCSCFITLLISILICVGFLFRNIRLEVQFVHTLVFGKGVCEPALKAPPLPHPLWHHAKIWFKPKTAGMEEGKQSQATFRRPNYRGWKTSTWVLCSCLSGVFAANFPLGHMCTFN